ncbi:MAG: ATP-dependent sacrificial sulfur transferase LarE [Phycisphaerae bacterium]|nr:ATP-dependent sacrificial sulfur transferase LarE [Phycisphaerae bacterium]
MVLEKLDRIEQALRSMGQVAVMLSGGVDSAFMLHVAVNTLGSENALALTGKSSSLAREEIEQAIRTAEAVAVEHVVLETDELSNPHYRKNAPDRCYHCKARLYELAKQYLRECGKRHTLVSGTNADDLGDWRPGIKAEEEYGVRCPAAEVGLSKSQIRALLQEWGLSIFDRPSSPCLASRIAYGEEITSEKLRRIEEAERFLREQGFDELRVRHHGPIARIEVPVNRIPELVMSPMRARIDAHLHRLGFAYVTLDLRGFRSGSLNEIMGKDEAG